MVGTQVIQFWRDQLLIALCFVCWTPTDCDCTTDYHRPTDCGCPTAVSVAPEALIDIKNNIIFNLVHVKDSVVLSDVVRNGNFFYIRNDITDYEQLKEVNTTSFSTRDIQFSNTEYGKEQFGVLLDSAFLVNDLLEFDLGKPAVSSL
jgi:hypothetical protein